MSNKHLSIDEVEALTYGALSACNTGARNAASVTPITTCARAEADPSALAGYLADHGVTTKFSSYDGAGLTARGRGRAILAAAAEVGADLLVMGAYGEKRLTALIGLGRATRKVVRATTLPALLQHYISIP